MPRYGASAVRLHVTVRIPTDGLHSIFQWMAYNLASSGVLYRCSRSCSPNRLAHLWPTSLFSLFLGVSYYITGDTAGMFFLRVSFWQAISDPIHGCRNQLSHNNSVALNSTYTSANLW